MTSLCGLGFFSIVLGSRREGPARRPPESKYYRSKDQAQVV